MLAGSNWCIAFELPLTPVNTRCSDRARLELLNIIPAVPFLKVMGGGGKQFRINTSEYWVFRQTSARVTEYSKGCSILKSGGG